MHPSRRMASRDTSTQHERVLRALRTLTRGETLSAEESGIGVRELAENSHASSLAGEFPRERAGRAFGRLGLRDY